MPEPEKPELEAVAWRAIPPLPADPKNSIMLYPGSEREEARVRYASGGWDVEPLCSLPAAQALLQGRDDRIAELEQETESLESSNRSLSEVLDELESKLARWRKVARAAAELITSNLTIDDWYLMPKLYELRNVVFALSEKERAELLKEGDHG